MINSRSGKHDPLIQNKAYLDFARNAPGYGQLQNDSVIAEIHQAFYDTPDGCQKQLEACYAAGTTLRADRMCEDADRHCVSLPGL